MSTLKVDNLQTTAGVSKYLASAWANFDITTTPNVIRASGNVSSITDYGVGDVAPVLSTAMIDANYAITAAGDQSASGGGGQSLTTIVGTRTSSTVRCYWKQGNNGTPYDTTAIYIAIIR